MTKVVNLSIHEASAAAQNKLTCLIRPVKNQPSKCHLLATDVMSPSGYSWIADAYHDVYVQTFANPGDILICRETWAFLNHFGTGELRIAWKADLDEIWYGPWLSSVRLPKVKARHHFIVKSMRVCRADELAMDEIIGAGYEGGCSVAEAECIQCEHIMPKCRNLYFRYFTHHWKLDLDAWVAVAEIERRG